jgi:hypothetical protein
LRTNEELKFDVTSLTLFVCPPNVDLISLAGMDEDVFLVRAILDHRLEGENKKLKTRSVLESQCSRNDDAS